MDIDAEDDDMPPLVSTTYTFLLDAASPHPGSSQVTTSPVPLPSSSNTHTTDPPMQHTGRPRSKPTRGAQAKKREASHIPRPPNAFILFRSSFIRSNQIPDTLEPNHSNLSKIIGHCWKALSHAERAEWEAKAVVAQEEHRKEFPDWRFRPGPYASTKLKTKDGGTARRRASKTADPVVEGTDNTNDEDGRKTRGKGKEKAGLDKSLRNTRCEKIAALMMVEGKTGSELTIAMEEWEDMNKRSSQTTDPAPQSPVPSSLASSPDRPAEPSPDLAQTPQSPAKTTPAEPCSTDDPRPPPKGISTVPLTQMFTRYRSTSTPSIADLCPPTQFDSHRPTPSTSTSTSTTQPQIHASSMEYRFAPSNWPTEERSYGSQSDPASFWQWQAPQTDLREAPSTDKRCAEDLPPREMGYETDATVLAYDSYGKGFGSGDLSPDGSEVVSWTTNPTRHGLMAVINDPLDDPPSLLSGPFGPSDPSPHPPAPLSIPPAFYYRPPDTPASLSLPATSFSTLTGWAGEYSYPEDQRGGSFDKVGRSRSPKLPNHAGGWYTDPGPSWSARPNDHQMGMVLSPDDWDRVEDLDLRNAPGSR